MNHSMSDLIGLAERLVRAVGMVLLAVTVCMAASRVESPTVKFTGGEMDLQTLLDTVPKDAVVVCEQAEPLVVSATITITRPMTLRGLKARLPEKLGDTPVLVVAAKGVTPVLVVAAKGVTLTDIEMHGNYDSVNQKNRAPFVQVKAGGFRVERCRFFDGTKDGINVVPDDGAGDIVGGVIRDIEGLRMGRDVVSLSGGCGGQRIRNVTVENVSIKKGYFRGAVEVSDGTDNIAVRHVRAEDAVYAIDVQDHGAVQKGKPAGSAPNTNITVEDVTAVDCKHVIRTTNGPLGHANLTLGDFTATNCRQPVLISNTTHVRIRNLTIVNEPLMEKPPITLRNCTDVELRNVKIVGLKDGAGPVDQRNSTNVRIEGLTRTSAAPAL
jgi:hypothetical protein